MHCNLNLSRTCLTEEDARKQKSNAAGSHISLTVFSEWADCGWASCVPLPSCSFQTDFLPKPRIVFPVVQTHLKWTIYWRVLCLRKHNCANLLTTRISNCSKFALDTHVFTNQSASYGRWKCSLKADVSLVADFGVFCVYGNTDFVISVSVYFCLVSKINTVE